MKQVEITISYRFIERLAFIIIILLLLALLIGKYVSEDCDASIYNASDEEAGKADETNTAAGIQNDEAGDNIEAKAKDNKEKKTEEEPEAEPEPEKEPEPEEEPELTAGELKAEIGKINFDIQADGRAKIDNIQISVQNGLDEDALLLATIYLTQSGNSDLELYNPVWNKVQMPLVKAGETRLISINPSKSWPPGIKDGDKLLIDAEFTDFQETIKISDSDSQTV